MLSVCHLVMLLCLYKGTLQSVLDPDGAQTRKSRRLKRRVHKNKVGVTKKYISSLLLPLPILCRESRKSRRLKRYRVQTMFDMLTVMYGGRFVLPALPSLTSSLRHQTS